MSISCLVINLLPQNSEVVLISCLVVHRLPQNSEVVSISCLVVQRLLQYETQFCSRQRRAVDIVDAHVEERTRVRRLEDG